MAKTYTVIQKIDVGSGGSSTFTFNSIPSTYTDLWIAISSRMEGGGLNGGYASLRINSDSGSNYYYQWLRAEINTSGVTSSAQTNSTSILCLNNSCANGNTAGAFSSSDIYISAYKSTSQKQISEYHCSENANGETWINLSAGKWVGSATISSIVITAIPANFGQYSSATLYGINNS